jgi:hypothetical protein
MTPSSPIHHRTDTHHSGRLSLGNTPACAAHSDSPVVAPLTRSRNAADRLPAHSSPHQNLCFDAKRQAPPPRSNLPAPHPVAKSP